MRAQLLTVVAVGAIFALGACDPLYQGWESVTQITIEGTKIVVQKDKRREGAFASAPDPYALQAVRIADLQRKNVLAIESVTGCTVITSTIFTAPNSTTYADVTC